MLLVFLFSVVLFFFFFWLQGFFGVLFVAHATVVSQEDFAHCKDELDVIRVHKTEAGGKLYGGFLWKRSEDVKSPEVKSRLPLRRHVCQFYF